MQRLFHVPSRSRRVVLDEIAVIRQLEGVRRRTRLKSRQPGKIADVAFRVGQVLVGFETERTKGDRVGSDKQGGRGGFDDCGPVSRGLGFVGYRDGSDGIGEAM